MLTTHDATRTQLPTAEEMKAASERMTHFWIGACSPLWAPFFAATSLGISTWMMSGALMRGLGGNAAYKDLPRGFVDAMTARYSWFKAGEEAAQVMTEMNDAVREAAVTPVKMVLEAEEVMIDNLKAHSDTAKAAADAAHDLMRDTADAANDEAMEQMSQTVDATTSQTPAPVTPEPGRAESDRAIEQTGQAVKEPGDDLPEPVAEPAFQPVPTVKAASKRRPTPKK